MRLRFVDSFRFFDLYIYAYRKPSLTMDGDAEASAGERLLANSRGVDNDRQDDMAAGAIGSGSGRRRVDSVRSDEGAFDGRESRESFMSTGSEAYSDAGDDSGNRVVGKGSRKASRNAKCIQAAAFVLCFAITFGLSFFLVQLASERSMYVPVGNSSAKFTTMSVRSMVRGPSHKVSSLDNKLGGVRSETPKRGMTLQSQIVDSSHTAPVTGVLSRNGSNLGGPLLSSNRRVEKLSLEKVQAADQSLEEDLNILQKIKEDHRTKNLDALSSQLENTTSLLGGDARLAADTQMVKELKQTLSKRPK